MFATSCGLTTISQYLCCCSSSRTCCAVHSIKKISGIGCKWTELVGFEKGGGGCKETEFLQCWGCLSVLYLQVQVHVCGIVHLLTGGGGGSAEEHAVTCEI